MKENIKVINDNKYSIGLLCHGWNKHRQVKPESFIYLNENEILQLDSDHDFFRSGELICEDEELNVKMGYATMNPNSITEVQIEDIFKLTPAKIKESLSGITEMFAIERVCNVAKRSDLSVSKLKAVEEVVGRKIELDDIVPEEVEKVEVKKTATRRK